MYSAIQTQFTNCWSPLPPDRGAIDQSELYRQDLDCEDYLSTLLAAGYLTQPLKIYWKMATKSYVDSVWVLVWVSAITGYIQSYGRGQRERMSQSKRQKDSIDGERGCVCVY